MSARFSLRRVYRLCVVVTVVAQVATVMQALGDIVGNLSAFFVFSSKCDKTCSKSSGAFSVRADAAVVID